MCLIVFAYRTSTEYPLILVANRDEFYARPTAPAHFWSDTPALLAGRDLEQGGTWMGITQTGRFAAVTNYRESLSASANTDVKKSRGYLTTDYLTTQTNLTAYLNQVTAEQNRYAGFNLLVGDFAETPTLYYASNRSANRILLKPGVYGLSNGTLNAPWPKLVAAKRDLAHLLHSGECINHASLSALLQQKDRAPLNELPETGIGRELELALSSAFIHMQGYGTRNTSSLVVSKGGLTHFTETSYDERAQAVSDASFSFSI